MILFVLAAVSSFEEECGPGFTCVARDQYGCAPISNASDMVCCSAAQRSLPGIDRYCSDSDKSKLPFCPAGGATGDGCLRMRSSSVGISTPRFDVSAANKTLHLAWASFCNETALKAWNCEWCGTNAYQGIALTAFLKDPLTGTQGYVALDAARQRVVVAYRGSKNLANGIEDGEFWLTRPPFGPSDIKVDFGFLHAYVSVRNATSDGIATALAKCPQCSLLFTGHSLGAAMATLGAAEHAGDAVAVQLYTFGSPRVGNAAFVAWARTRLNRPHAAPSVRMRREKDIVAAIPPRSMGYRHLPTEVWNTHSSSDGDDEYVVCDGSGEDEACGDSEEHPPFPLDLLHLKPSEHTLYMGYKGGSCIGGHNND